MILALEQLHLRGIVYRDLKPENVMINEKGHLLLIDMGTAKVLNNSKKGLSRTYTILGTPHYMAPEILKGKGYDFAVDIWSLGICMYEFMCGLVPFGEECEDPYEVYQLISSQSLSYPNYFKDKKNKYARALIEQLLNRNPNSRTGGSFDALKANMWFGDFDWDKLAFMELEPPFVPPANKLISQQEIQKLENNKVSFKLYVQVAFAEPESEHEAHALRLQEHPQHQERLRLRRVTANERRLFLHRSHTARVLKLMS